MSWSRLFASMGGVTVSLAASAVLAAAVGSLPDSLEIWQIQGSGLSSPFEGQVVTTDDNSVTAVGSEGFFIQTPDLRADLDDQTSNGLYVVTDVSPELQVGDWVDVTGRVVEFFGRTQIESPELTVISAGNPVPSVVDFDVTTPTPNQPWPPSELERFEGMRVRVETGVVTASTNEFGDACVAAKTERLFREPGIKYPGLPGLAVFDGNPESFELDPDALGLNHVVLHAGTVFGATGVLSWAFGEYQLWPTALAIISVPELPRPVRARRRGEFTVAAQNVERLADDGAFPAFEDRLQKLSKQIREVLRAPDILALQEVEDLSTLSALASRISEDDPAIVYTPYLTEGNDFSGFDVAFLIRDSVRVVAVTQIGADVIFSYDNSLLNDRPPLVLEAEYLGYDAPFEITVVVVHLRSLVGIEDPIQGDRVRQKRAEQSVWLADWIQQRQSSKPEERLLVIGDFNAFEFSDGYVDVMGQITGRPDPGGAMIPVVDIVQPPLDDWAWSMSGDERYSFVFQCSAEVLDHVVTNRWAGQWVAGVAFSRGNSDVSELYREVATTALRSSDHDGAVVYIGPRWRRPAGRRMEP